MPVEHHLGIPFIDSAEHTAQGPTVVLEHRAHGDVGFVGGREDRCSARPRHRRLQQRTTDAGVSAGRSDDEELDEVSTEERSGVGDDKAGDLVAHINVNKTLARCDRTVENLTRPIGAEARDLALESERFEGVGGGGEADDAVILAREGQDFGLLSSTGACREGWLLLRTHVRFFGSSTLAAS